MESFWNNDRIEKLRQLWADGLSASEIASSLCAESRSAVIGKVHRLGLSARKTVMSAEQREKSKQRDSKRRLDKQRASRGRKTIQIRGLKMDDAPLPTAQAYEGSLRIPYRDLREFSDLGPNQCRYIADDPPGPDYVACGNETPDGEPYCRHCRPLTVSNSHSTPEERAAHISMGVRRHLRALRRVA